MWQMEFNFAGDCLCYYVAVDAGTLVAAHAVATFDRQTSQNDVGVRQKWCSKYHRNVGNTAIFD